MLVFSPICARCMVYIGQFDRGEITANEAQALIEDCRNRQVAALLSDGLSPYNDGLGPYNDGLNPYNVPNQPNNPGDSGRSI